MREGSDAFARRIARDMRGGEEGALLFADGANEEIEVVFVDVSEEDEEEEEKDERDEEREGYTGGGAVVRNSAVEDTSVLRLGGASTYGTGDRTVAAIKGAAAAEEDGEKRTLGGEETGMGDGESMP